MMFNRCIIFVLIYNNELSCIYTLVITAILLLLGTVDKVQHADVDINITFLPVLVSIFVACRQNTISRELRHGQRARRGQTEVVVVYDRGLAVPSCRSRWSVDGTDL